jgi:phosphatidylserine/phosphatidylglycerophosphate/cardiolipin synthase-like enzyme
MNLTMASTIRNHEIGVIVDDPADLQSIRSYITDLVGAASKKSIGGGRVISMQKAPSGEKEIRLKVIKATRENYHARIDGKYPVKISMTDVSSRLEPGREYTCTAVVQWRRINNKNKATITGVTNIRPS